MEVNLNVVMEESWKKFKEQTEESMRIINEFLDDISSNEKSQLRKQVIMNDEISQEPEPIPQPMSPTMPQPLPEPTAQVFLDDEKYKIPELPKQMFVGKDETSQLIQEMFSGKPLSDRKKTYGKLRDMVKEIMEREHVSRAQAYRRAKRILNS